MVVAALAGCYMTTIHPSRSEAGKLSTRFVVAVGARDATAASALLSKSRRDALAAGGVLAEVPARMTNASGFDINGTESVTQGGTEITCIEGLLEYSKGAKPKERTISFKLVDEGGLKIDGWSTGWCRHGGYWYRQ